MKQKRLLSIRLGASFVFAFVAFAAISTVSVLAADRTWTGAGSDNKLSTAANWGGTAPANGDKLIFTKAAFPSFDDCTAPWYELENDLDSSITLSGIVFGQSTDTGSGVCSTGGSGQQGIKISEGVLKVAGDIESHWGYKGRIASDIVLTTDALLEANVSGQVSIGSHKLTLSKSSLTGKLVGSGQVVIGKQNSGTCDQAGTNSLDSSEYTGAVVVECGYVYANLVKSASSVTLKSNTLMIIQSSFGQDLAITTPLVFESGSGMSFFQGYGSAGSLRKVNTITLSGAIDVRGKIIIVLDYSNVKFTGAVAGNSNISVEKGGVGEVSFPDGSKIISELMVTTPNDSYCTQSDYGLNINANNKYIWNIDCPGYGKKTGDNGYGRAYDGNIYGILAGTGSIGSLIIKPGGVIAPGNSPGVITVANLSFEEHGVYEFEIAGSEAGQYDQINVTGAVKLGNGTLKVLKLGEFAPSKGQQYVIIANDGADAVEGIFAGLDEGAPVEVDGVAWFTISYKGGDGNDVVLTTIPGVADTGEIKSSSRMTLMIAVGAVLALMISVKSRKFAALRR